MCKYPIPVKGKLLARRACSFSLLRHAAATCPGVVLTKSEARQSEDWSSKEKILSAHVCVRLRLINSDHQHLCAGVSRLAILF